MYLSFFLLLFFRLFLRQFAIELLNSAFNIMVRQVRRTLDRGTTGNDDSYLLWIIRFFLEFNRLNEFKIPLVRFVDSIFFVSILVIDFIIPTSSLSVDTRSEALSTQNFHWVLGRVQHHLDMLTSDKQNIKLWEKRLSIAIQVRELVLVSPLSFSLSLFCCHTEFFF